MEHLDLLHIVSRTLDDLDIRYFITGSAASIIYGETRFTNDVDVVVDLPRAKVDALCGRFPQPAFYVSTEAARHAVSNRSMFNVIHVDTGLKADMIVPAMDSFDQQCFARARRVTIGDAHPPLFIAPEDVILHKLRFFMEGRSDKHLRDITGILKVSGQSLDHHLIEEWVSRFNAGGVWKSVKDRASGSPGETR